jgi:hypothetical protein
LVNVAEAFLEAAGGLLLAKLMGDGDDHGLSHVFLFLPISVHRVKP